MYGDVSASRVDACRGRGLSRRSQHSLDESVVEEARRIASRHLAEQAEEEVVILLRTDLVSPDITKLNCHMMMEQRL